MNLRDRRREYTEALRAACAPTRVVEEEPDVVADVTVAVCWVGAAVDPEGLLGWLHQFETRIILPSEGLGAPYFARRDELVEIVARFGNEWSPPAAPTINSTRHRFELRAVVVGGTPTKAVICRHTICEPIQAATTS